MVIAEAAWTTFLYVPWRSHAYCACAIVFALLAFQSPAFSTDKPNVLYAGFLLAGKSKDIPTNFKYTSQLIYKTTKDNNGKTVLATNSIGQFILRDHGAPKFFKQFYAFHKQHAEDVQKINLVLDKSNEKATKTKFVMGLALVGEYVRISTASFDGVGENLGKSIQRHLIWVYLCLDYIIMDFTSGTLRYSVPIYYPKVWSLERDSPPTEDEILSYVRQTYFSSLDKNANPDLMKRLQNSGVEALKKIKSRDFVSLQHTLLPKLKKLSVKPKGFLALQLVKFKLGKLALKGLGKYAESNPLAVESLLAQSISDHIANDLGVCVMPYDRNAAHAKMSFTLPDNSECTLDIPKAYYGIDMTIQALIALPKQETRTESAFLLGAYAKIKVSTRNGQITFWNKKYKHGEKIVIMRKMKDTWDFTADHFKMIGLLTKKILREVKTDKDFVKGVIEPCR